MVFDHFLVIDRKRFVYQSYYFNFLSLRLEENIACNFLEHFYIQMMK